MCASVSILWMLAEHLRIFQPPTFEWLDVSVQSNENRLLARLLLVYGVCVCTQFSYEVQNVVKIDVQHLVRVFLMSRKRFHCPIK